MWHTKWRMTRDYDTDVQEREDGGGPGGSGGLPGGGGGAGVRFI